MTKDATEYVETCNTGCAPATNKNSPLPMGVRDTPDRPWQHVAADFKGPIVGNGRSYYFHVMIDTLSRWPEVTMVRSTAFDKLQDKLEDVFSLQGVPETVTSDNGPPYCSKDWRKFGKQMGFKPLPVSPEHPEANGIAERFMATIVKTTHAAIAEGKDPKLEIKRRLLNYRNTPHPSTGKTPSELMMGRVVRTRVPQLIKTPKNKSLQEAKQKDRETREKRKEKFDKRKTAKERDIKEGDRVLVAQKKTTTKPPFDPKPYKVTEVKGSQIVVERGDKTRVRNMGKVKLLKPRPDRLQLRVHHNTPHEESSDDEEWFEMPNATKQQEPVVPQYIPEPAAAEEEALDVPGEFDEDEESPNRKSTRRRRQTKFLGIQEEPSNPQISPQQRKRNQSLAKKRGKQEGRAVIMFQGRKYGPPREDGEQGF